MRRRQTLSAADLLDAFRQAIVVTQGTVEAGTPAAAELEKMLSITTRMLDQADDDEYLWRVMTPVLDRLERAASHA